MIYKIDRMWKLFRAGLVTPRLAWNYARGRRKVLLVEATARCNLACSFCVIRDMHGAKGSMTPETFRNVEKILPRVGVVNLAGWGESFLQPDLFRMIRASKAAGCSTYLTSNATLLDEARARELVDSGLDALQVSFDGATAATYEAHRVGARFERVVGNLRTFVELRRRRGAKTPCLMMQYVATIENVHELPAMVDLAADLGVIFLTFRTVEHVASEEQARLSLWPVPGRPLPRAEIRAALAEALRRGRAKGLAISLLGKMNALDDDRLVFNPYSCDPGSVVFVSYAGDVSPCCPLAYTMPRYFQGSVSEQPHVRFGNINERSFDEIWNSPEYREFREGFAKGRTLSSCSTCYLYYGW